MDQATQREMVQTSDYLKTDNRVLRSAVLNRNLSRALVLRRLRSSRLG